MLMVLERACQLAVVDLVGLLRCCGRLLGTTDGTDVLAHGVLTQTDHTGPFLAAVGVARAGK